MFQPACALFDSNTYHVDSINRPVISSSVSRLNPLAAVVQQVFFEHLSTSLYVQVRIRQVEY